MALTSLEITKNRMTALKPLHDRMDKTRDRVYNTPYVMPSLSDKTKPMDNVISVTMPFGAIVANTVINDLMTSFPQTIAADSAKTFMVRFSPTGVGDFSGTLTFATSDPAIPNLVFDVAGTGTTPFAGTLNFVEYVKDDSNGVNGLAGTSNAGVSGMDEPSRITISSDDSHVYVSGVSSDAVAVFSRNKSTRGELNLCRVC